MRMLTCTGFEENDPAELLRQEGLKGTNEIRAGKPFADEAILT